jgi:hypothetical protein
MLRANRVDATSGLYLALVFWHPDKIMPMTNIDRHHRMQN